MRIFNIFFLGALLGILPHLGIAQKSKKRNTPQTEAKPISTRAFWLQEMDKMARPVVRSLAHDSLRILMPKIVSKWSDNKESRVKVQYVEVLGRVLCGIAPWLQLEGGSAEEIALRNQYRKWVIQGISNSLDSTKNDFMRYDEAAQQLVDASFLTLAFVRAPWIWENLLAEDKERMVAAIKTTRMYKPPLNNWLLFAAMNEVFLAQNGYDFDIMRIDFALQQHEQWYVGDGMYQDGANYAFDYYNSYVIHPYLAAVVNSILPKYPAYKNMAELIKKRNERFAVIQERMIGVDGSFPPTGRSLIYRGAAFQHLADMALRKALPKELSPAQVRCALTAVIRKTLGSPTTYENGWLTLGLYGSQPSITDYYNNQGSLYLASVIFLPLGLPESDDFWTMPDEKWTQQKVWGGDDVKGDYKVGLKN